MDFRSLYIFSHLIIGVNNQQKKGDKNERKRQKERSVDGGYREIDI